MGVCVGVRVVGGGACGPGSSERNGRAGRALLRAEAVAYLPFVEILESCVDRATGAEGLGRPGGSTRQRGVS